MTNLDRPTLEAILNKLATHAWDGEIRWGEISSWADNFQGHVLQTDIEQLYALFALSRFMYFGRRLIREMLKSLYRDHFESPLLQRLRRSARGGATVGQLRHLYQQELATTRFVGVGNPAESGAHLLYYFRQVNHLPKNLFVDLASAFNVTVDATQKVSYAARQTAVARYVFFDDLVGSGVQASAYLRTHLMRIRAAARTIELRFMSLFATTSGLARLNQADLFDGRATCLFELDDTFKAFGSAPRYFNPAPTWFRLAELLQLCELYGSALQPDRPLGYRDGQLLLGFFHNTPDNTLPIFWDEGRRTPWSPIFVRYDKNYGPTP